MTTLTQSASESRQPGWFSRAEHWLDSKGKGAWIAAMVLAFILFWPVGLTLLAYMIWGKQMFNRSCRTTAKWYSASTTLRQTGNSAFDAYKADTLRRLEEEQEKFEAFLERLRKAKDQAEFDQFMEDRARRSDTGTSDA